MQNNLFESPFELYTPILLLVFNRLDTTRSVFEAIKQAKPKKLYIAADGPRIDHPGEDEIVQSVRDFVMNSINWECDVKTLFRDQNLGCKKAISSAIDWFFSQVEEGIILEDDCVPSQSFFPFCQELLKEYRDDERVMMISGMNYLFNKIEMKESYFFSRYYPIWGWATWKRAWSKYDIKMSNWPEYASKNILSHIYCHAKFASFLNNMLQKAYQNQVDTWDIQWVYTCIVNNGLTISPKYNLVSNIGIIGTHGDKSTRFNFIPLKEIDVSNIVHPHHVMPTTVLDNICFDEITKGESKLIKFREFFNRQKKNS
jgi:hypothetical protein